MHNKEEGQSRKLMTIKTSRKAYLLIYLMILIILFALIFFKYKNLPINKMSLFVVLAFLFFAIKYTEIHRMSHTWEITSDKFIHTSGLINKKIKKLDFFSISDVEVHQTPWQRLLGYGDMNIHQFSEIVSLKNINSPQKVADFLEDTIELKRKITENSQEKNIKKWPK